MIIKEEFLNKLRQSFKLNIYEVKIWTALLGRGVSTAGELSDISNVPRSRSYDVLESLEKKGFIIMKLGKPIQYIAVKPDEIVKRIKSNVQERADERIIMLEKVKTDEVYAELQLLFKQGINLVEPESLSGAFKGRTNIHRHLESLLTDAKKSIIIVTTAEGIKRKFKVLKNTLKKAKERGVKIKIVAPLDKLTKENQELIKNVAEIKQLKDIKARFTLVDEKNILFMVMDDSSIPTSSDVGIWVNTPYFASALGTMFNLSWKKA